MIEPAARMAWRNLEAKLRPFIARRVRAGVDVDDVLQDVFVRMQRSLPALREAERFGPWVYKVARSAIVDHRRRAAKHQVAGADAGAELAHELDAGAELAHELEEDDGAVERELAAYVAPFVATLPSPYREAVTLTELEGLTQKQAAAMLGISLPGMKSRVQRGRRQLREALEDCCSIALDARGRVMSCEPRVDGRAPDWCCRNASL